MQVFSYKEKDNMQVKRKAKKMGSCHWTINNCPLFSEIKRNIVFHHLDQELFENRNSGFVTFFHIIPEGP